MPRAKFPCVCILASGRNGTIYVGVTSDLPGRMEQHRQGLTPGFTSRYGVKALVYYEMHETMPEAIAREKRLKGWNRAWKLRLIEAMNPEWRRSLRRRHGRAPGWPRRRRAVRGLTSPLG